MSEISQSIGEGLFSLTDLFAYPAAELSQVDQEGPRKRIAIIGGGIAGLTAAYELEKHDHLVTIFEATERLGGRMQTHTFADGSHAELGAMRIPANHGCTLHYVSQFDLKTRPFVNHNPNAFFFMKGQRFRIRDWRDLSNLYHLSATERREPSRVYEDRMAYAMANLSTPEKWAMFGPEPLKLAKEYDSMSLRQYLLASGLSAEAIEYVGHSNGMINYERASFLETLIDYFGLLRIDQIELVDGMSNFVRAISNALHADVRLSESVKSVSIASDGVLLRTDRNAEFPFDYAICTTPLGRLHLLRSLLRFRRPSSKLCGDCRMRVVRRFCCTSLSVRGNTRTGSTEVGPSPTRPSSRSGTRLTTLSQQEPGGSPR